MKYLIFFTFFLISVSVFAFNRGDRDPVNECGTCTGSGGGSEQTLCDEARCGCPDNLPGERLISWDCACSSIMSTRTCVYVLI